MTMQIVEATLLIPGRGEPVRDGVVAFDGARITYAGPASDAPPHVREGTDRVRVPVVMPGLWDCHAHFMGVRDLDLVRVVTTPAPVLAARAAKDAEAALQAGFTSVREVGGFGIHLAQVVDEGTIAGPTIYAAGAILSQTGGHGDLHSLPLATILDHSRAGGVLQLCDGIAECLKAVRMQLRRGARVIKVCASGGVLSEVDHPVHQQFSDEELRTIVEEAARADRIVAAHCHGKPGIMAALRAGCRTIEHGSYLDDEAAVTMREADAILVPTRFIVERMLGSIDRVPSYARPKITALADSHHRAIGIAHEAGVRIALGTDIVTSGAESLVPWGANGGELAHLVAAGLSPLEAIEAGTANGPMTLGPQAPRSGLLAEGYEADVIALDADPLEDIRVLGEPSHVTHVWKTGRLVKAPV